MKVLIASDAHVPDREREIPKEIREFLASEAPFDLVLYAGDLTGPEVLEWLKGLGEEVKAVRGNMDYLPLPEEALVELDGVKALVVHGHQVRPRGNLDALSAMALSRGARVIVHGHLHKPLIKEHKGVLHLNPGSVTGTWGGSSLGGDPTFMIVRPSKGALEVDLYALKGGRLERSSYSLRI
ncbi:YfcE family phosphodiesterase [Ignicoccus hospitalis]|uniref:YfcE family phosphodiesterase n=1 Tax=Ignicoccus hospitalis TaxID=160233 RepID=UPI0016502F46|nr:metallophosphoesterase [Ignicoccus hospitalis]HIH91041.1 metallophosphoesterase [Desulfurococcaceae archaeon]